MAAVLTRRKSAIEHESGVAIFLKTISTDLQKHERCALYIYDAVTYPIRQFEDVDDKCWTFFYQHFSALDQIREIQ